MFSILGHFMYVDMSHGQEGDSAVLTGKSNSVDSIYQCISFHHYQSGVNAGFLSVTFNYDNGYQEIVFMSTEANQERWFNTHLPFHVGLQNVQFIVTRGPREEGIIAIDEVDLLLEAQCVG